MTSKVVEEVPWGEVPSLWLVCRGDTLYKFKTKERANAFAVSFDEVHHNDLADSHDISNWRKMNQNTICCAKAFPVFCVCRISFQCDIHGSKCVGSHE